MSLTFHWTPTRLFFSNDLWCFYFWQKLDWRLVTMVSWVNCVRWVYQLSWCWYMVWFLLSTERKNRRLCHHLAHRENYSCFYFLWPGLLTHLFIRLTGAHFNRFIISNFPILMQILHSRNMWQERHFKLFSSQMFSCTPLK